MPNLVQNWDYRADVFLHKARNHANLLGQKEVSTQKKSSIPTGQVWDSSMAAVFMIVLEWTNGMNGMDPIVVQRQDTPTQYK